MNDFRQTILNADEVLKKELDKINCTNEIVIKPEQFNENLSQTKANKIDCYRPKKCCDICGKLFFGLKRLRYHMNTHSGLRPYVCKFEYCEKAFTSPVEMNGHYKRSHTDYFLYECKICGSKFKVLTSFKDHMSYHEEPHLPCNYCGKLFRNPYEF